MRVKAIFIDSLSFPKIVPKTTRYTLLRNLANVSRLENAIMYFQIACELPLDNVISIKCLVWLQSNCQASITQHSLFGLINFK